MSTASAARMPEMARPIKYSPSMARGIARLKGGWKGAASRKDRSFQMRRLFLPACLVLAATATAAWGQECDRGDDSQSMMTICANTDYEAADAKLNAAYKDLVGGNDEKANKLLQTAQRAWIAFRDAECAYSTADSEGGSVHPMEVSECLMELTNQRIKQLTSGSNCQAGETSCASPNEDEDQDMQ